MSNRFDYERRGEEFYVFDRLGEGGSDRPLAICTDAGIAAFLAASLRRRDESLAKMQQAGQEYEAADDKPS